jgi:hypothetical protein
MSALPFLSASRRRSFASLAGLVLLAALSAARSAAPLPVEGLRDAVASSVSVRREGNGLTLRWPVTAREWAELKLDLRPSQPLVEQIGLAASSRDAAAPVLHGLDPVWFLTVGSRKEAGGRPPGMSPFNEFFDNPASRPHESYLARYAPEWVRVERAAERATVRLGTVSAGPFSGELRFNVYARSRLIQAEAVMRTREDLRAFVYDAGLVGRDAGWKSLAWTDTDGRIQRRPVREEDPDASMQVRHRTLVVEGEGGSLACFPPPHQFFFPRDYTDNLSTVWSGTGHRGRVQRFGFGIRQPETGGGAFVPWFNAPPRTDQHLSVFYLPVAGRAEEALKETLRYTHGDRFPKLPGHVTLTSHWHMAVAVAAMQRRERGEDPAAVPDFVRMFKEMGVDAVHLAEFHGDGHQNDPGPLRLPEMRAMFDECRRLSDRDLLLLPGEEVSGILGISEPGKHPGHWMSLFPRPVYWTMRRAPDQPFVEEQPPYGTVYHVGGPPDMLALLEREKGLGWTSHPRIKASSWTPDVYRNESFYRSDRWLGAAWKAMPADLSRPKLGERALDLFDDMANWGPRKYLPGEVDVFKLDHTHELYGHMNVNYLRLARLPRFEEGWQPVLDALRAGRFFVSTGEVLINDFTLGGRRSGETVTTAPGSEPELKAQLSWTFPLRFAEVISGDGERVYREKIDLTDTTAFGARALRLRPDLRGRKWARLEVWDVAANGAYTQPVWLESR